MCLDFFGSALLWQTSSFRSSVVPNRSLDDMKAFDFLASTRESRFIPIDFYRDPICCISCREKPAVFAPSGLMKSNTVCDALPGIPEKPTSFESSLGIKLGPNGNVVSITLLVLVFNRRTRPRASSVGEVT